MKRISAIVVIGIICLGFLEDSNEIISYIQVALILFLILVCLPVIIYQYNTNKRKEILQHLNK